LTAKATYHKLEAVPAIIDAFDGPHLFLSNFYAAPFEWRGVRWHTVEHAYQAAKTDNAGAATAIANARTAGQAKKLGRAAPIRAGWEQQKVSIMRELLEAKFRSHPHLTDALLATGDAVLIEGNRWGDTFWGVCRGRGANMLGQLLMSLRADLALEREIGMLGA
jgi:ribA/ribD-fused uncharacterized protein